MVQNDMALNNKQGGTVGPYFCFDYKIGCHMDECHAPLRDFDLF